MLIYVPKMTHRMGYTLNVVFHHILQTEYAITTDVDYFRQYDGARLCYAPEPVDDSPFLHATSLLFTSAVVEQALRPCEYEGIPALYPVYDKRSILPFDALAAAFYMVSRYEEYLPHRVDIHGRFPACESVAYKYGFLQLPVVDHWALALYDKLRQDDPSLPALRRRFHIVATVDIDAAYCYRYKGIMRTAMGVLRDIAHHEPLRERFEVLLGRRQDPYDTFDYLLELHRRHPNVQMLFFALLGDYGEYDKPISYANSHFRELLQHLDDYAKMGVHTSYQSADNPRLVHEETERLTDILHRPIVRNRTHYLRVRVPHTYRVLVDEDIRHDYTMGYAEETGFRAGTATPFPCYDLERDEELPLLIHPFCVMDTTLMLHKNMNAEQARVLCDHYLEQTRKVGAPFCAIWHNQNVCDTERYRPWRALLKDILAQSESAPQGEDIDNQRNQF